MQPHGLLLLVLNCAPSLIFVIILPVLSWSSSHCDMVNPSGSVYCLFWYNGMCLSLQGYPYSREKLFQAAQFDIPPPLRALVWAALLGVKVWLVLFVVRRVIRYRVGAYPISDNSVGWNSVKLLH